jgi:hypothetical protein
MRIDSTVRSPLNVDSTANCSKSSSTLTCLYASSAKKCRMVATRDVPVFLMLAFSCSFACCVTGSSFVASRDASTAMSPMVLFPSSRSQNPEAGERA